MLALLRICLCARSLSTEQMYKLLTSWPQASDGLQKPLYENRFVLSMTPASQVRFAPVSSDAYAYYLRTVDGVLTLTNVSRRAQTLLCEAELPEAAEFSVVVNLNQGAPEIAPVWTEEPLFSGERLKSAAFTEDCALDVRPALKFATPDV